MKTALIIDDNETLRDALARAVTFMGLHPLQASNGVAGVELARSHRPHVVLCDLFMDPGDGFYVLSKLRADPVTASIPCILLSDGAHIAGERKRIEEYAPDAFLPKPFSLADLRKVLSAQGIDTQSIVRG